MSCTLSTRHKRSVHSYGGNREVSVVFAHQGAWEMLISARIRLQHRRVE
jgi:hypothetical protein